MRRIGVEPANVEAAGAVFADAGEGELLTVWGKGEGNVEGLDAEILRQSNGGAQGGFGFWGSAMGEIAQGAGDDGGDERGAEDEEGAISIATGLRFGGGCGDDFGNFGGGGAAWCRLAAGVGQELRADFADALELKFYVVGGLPAVVRIFGQASFHQAIKHERRIGLNGRNGGRIAFENGGDDAGGGLAFEGAFAGRHFEENGAE